MPIEGVTRITAFRSREAIVCRALDSRINLGKEEEFSRMPRRFQGSLLGAREKECRSEQFDAAPDPGATRPLGQSL